MKPLFLACKWLPFHCVFMWWREREFWGLFLIRTPVLTNYFLKAMFSNKVMLKVRALT